MTRDFILVITSLFAWGIGEGMFIYFQPLYLQQLGADPLAIGAIFGGMGVVIAIAQAPAGYLADRIGNRPIMWMSWVLGAVMAWCMALAGNLTVFIIALLAYWMSSFVTPPLNSYISHARGEWSVGRALTISGGIFQAGSVIGPLIGGELGQHYGLKTVYFAAASVLVVSVAIVLFIKPQPVSRDLPSETGSLLHQNRRFLAFLAIAFLAMFASYMPSPLTPNFLQDHRSLTLTQIGQLGSIGSLGNAILSLGLGHLYAPGAFLIGQVFVGVFSVALWQGTGFFWYGLGYFFFGGYRLCRVMAIAMVRPLIRSSEVGFAFGVLETVNSSAVILAPVIAGFLYTLKPTLMYPVSLVVLGISLATGAWFLFASQHSPLGVENVS